MSTQVESPATKTSMVFEWFATTIADNGESEDTYCGTVHTTTFNGETSIMAHLQPIGTRLEFPLLVGDQRFFLTVEHVARAGKHISINNILEFDISGPDAAKVDTSEYKFSVNIGAVRTKFPGNIFFERQTDGSPVIAGFGVRISNEIYHMMLLDLYKSLCNDEAISARTYLEHHISEVEKIANFVPQVYITDVCI